MVYHTFHMSLTQDSTLNKRRKTKEKVEYSTIGIPTRQEFQRCARGRCHWLLIWTETIKSNRLWNKNILYSNYNII